MFQKSSFIKISFALAVISFYTFVFGVIDVVDGGISEAVTGIQTVCDETENNPSEVLGVYEPPTGLINVANRRVPRLGDFDAPVIKRIVSTTVTRDTLETREEPEPSDNSGEPGYSGYETELPPELTVTAATVSTTNEPNSPSATTTIVTTTTARVTTAPSSTTAVVTTTPHATTTAATTRTTPVTTTAATTTVANPNPPGGPPGVAETFRIMSGGELIEGPAFDILTRVVEAEVGGGFHPEAIKAQAVAAYTYIKRHNLAGSIPNLPTRPASANVVRYTREVWGTAIFHNGELIQAAFSASSAGWSASSLNVWGRDIPYLRSIRTAFDEVHDPRWQNFRSFTSAEIRDFVREETGIELTGDPNTWLRINAHVDTVYVGEMSIGGHTSYVNDAGVTVPITGRAFRERILRFNLRSASFTFVYNSADDMFTFTTNGFGHGVGMSQNGANTLAKHHNFGYRDILLFYYQGVTVR
jgi:stage II sporulation protein D